MASGEAEYVAIEVTDNVEREAQGLRAERDKRYRNIYQEADSDLRWVGEVGEICFNNWLPIPHEWLQDQPVGKPDFVVAENTTVGIKTVKRKGPVLPHYTAQITAKHAAEPVDFFFFTCYQFTIKRLWLLGAIGKAEFLKKAIYHKAGGLVHGNYIIRPGHEIYNIEIRYLTPPLKWIEQLT